MAKLRITHITPHDSPGGGGAVVSLEWVKLDTSGLISKLTLMSTCIHVIDYPKGDVFEVT